MVLGIFYCKPPVKTEYFISCRVFYDVHQYTECFTRSEYIFCIAHQWGREMVLFSSAEKSRLPLALDLTSETPDNLIFQNNFWYNRASSIHRGAATEFRFSSVQYDSPSENIEHTWTENIMTLSYKLNWNYLLSKYITYKYYGRGSVKNSLLPCQEP